MVDKQQDEAGMEVRALNSLNNIRKEIIKYFKLNKEEAVEIRIEVTKMEILLRTNWFIVSAFKYKGEERNVITFEVGCAPGAIADMTRIISKHIPPSTYTVGRSHFRDKKTDKLTFGEAAYQAKEEEVAAMSGRKPCVVCENFTDINKLNKTGLCAVCSAMGVQNHITWN
jgi:hypothetical protein